MASCHCCTFWRKTDFWQSGCTCHLLQRVSVHLVTPFPSPIVKGSLAGRSPLICSRAVIIGPLRSLKDTQHVAEIEFNSLPRERTSNSLASFVMISLLCQICVGTTCCLYLLFFIYKVAEWISFQFRVCSGRTLAWVTGLFNYCCLSMLEYCIIIIIIEPTWQNN